MTENLRKMGADIQATEDGMIIHGGKPLHGAEIDSHLDHRVAMSFAVAGLLSEGTLSPKMVNVSTSPIRNSIPIFTVWQNNYQIYRQRAFLCTIASVLSDGST